MRASQKQVQQVWNYQAYDTTKRKSDRFVDFICIFADTMNKILLTISILIFALNIEAQENDYIQMPNYDFEEWNHIGTKNEEPYRWHSFKTSTGPFHYLLLQQVERHEATRPGSNGKYSARIFSRSIVGITANGNLTNGRLNAGSMFPAGTKNNNYTQRNTEFCTEINKAPDSLTVWICLRTKNIDSYGRIMSYVHGDADFICTTGGWEPYEMICAQVEHEFQRTSSMDEDMRWERISIPLKKKKNIYHEPRYILTSFTTNRKAGEGDAGDEMFIDDLYLIYNPTLEVAIKEDGSETKNEIEIEFIIDGTMSPPNINLPPNDVIVQLAFDKNFSNFVEIGKITTNKSGSIRCEIPDAFVDKDYYIKVKTTNYPMESMIERHR